MRIRVLGSSLVSSYWNGAATYYRGLLKALAQRGHDIAFYEPDAFERQQHRDMADLDWARVVVYTASEDGWRRALEDAARDADLLVKASGIGAFDRELELAVPALAPARTITAFLDVDAPATLERIHRDPRDHMRERIGDFDIVFTYGGGQPVVDAYRALGARQCVPVYNALDPDTHHPVPKQPEFDCALSFLGNRLPDREARVHEFFFDAARRSPQRRFLLGGAGWNQQEMPKNVRALGHVGTRDHNAFFCSGLATLNVTRDSMARNGFSPATRVFEAAGAGACQITDAWEGVEQFFEPEREILVAADGGEVAALLDALTPQRAAEIGQAALRRVRRDHTYAQRAHLVEQVLEGLGRSSDAAA